MSSGKTDRRSYFVNRYHEAHPDAAYYVHISKRKRPSKRAEYFREYYMRSHPLYPQYKRHKRRIVVYENPNVGD